MTAWVRVVLWGGAIANLLVAAGIGVRVSRHAEVFSIWQDPTLRFLWGNAVWLCVIAVAGTGVIAYRRLRRRLPATVAAASAIMAAHVATLAIGAWAWLRFAPSPARYDTHFPVWDVLPPVAFVPPVIAVLALAAFPARRTQRVVNGIVRFALVQLLCLGLVLPFAARWWPDAKHALYRCPVVIPGVLLAATAIMAAIALYDDQRQRRSRGSYLAGGIALTAAILFMPGEGHLGTIIYSNMVHVMLGAAGIALAGLVSATVIRWRLSGGRGAGEPVTGRAVSDDGGPVGRIEYVGWLRGLRAVTERFRLETPRGPIEIPAGARLVVPTPIATSHLKPGESTTVLPTGAEVTVTGLPFGSSDPFRSAAIADAATVVVSADHAPRSERTTGVLLWLWRPFVLYLAVTAVVALPPAITAGTPYDADGATEQVAEVLGHEPVLWSSPIDAYEQYALPGETIRCLDRRARTEPLGTARETAHELAIAKTCWEFRHPFGCPSAYSLLPYMLASPADVERSYDIIVVCREDVLGARTVDAILLDHTGNRIRPDGHHHSY